MVGTVVILPSVKLPGYCTGKVSVREALVEAIAEKLGGSLLEGNGTVNLDVAGHGSVLF